MSQGLDGGDRWELTTEELAAGFVSKIVAWRRMESELLADLAELGNRGGAVELGYGTAEKFVADTARTNRREARRMVRRAAALHDTTSLSGTPVPAALPATATAMSEGTVAGNHVDVIAEFRASLPADVDAEAWTVAEEVLADIARTVPPRGLKRPIEELRARLDSDGNLPSEKELAYPDRSLRTGWIDDRFRMVGEFDREAGLLIEAALSPLTAPRDADDKRSIEERRADALPELIGLAVDTERVPGEGGAAVTLLLTLDETSLRQRIGAATTMDGQQIPVSQVRKMACDAGVIPVLLGRDREVRDIGDRARTAPARVRRQLIVRDRGCAFPGCDRPPAHTHGHHVRHWADGGESTVDNMVLVCPVHHRLVHHSAWEVSIVHGRPEFVPPTYVDPYRSPRGQPLVA